MLERAKNAWDPRMPSTADVRLLGIHDLANAMLECGYTGQNLENPNAEVYIAMASEDPDVESNLPERGVKFWNAARFKFQIWLMRMKLGLKVASLPSRRP
jgi:hypothetical protein